MLIQPSLHSYSLKQGIVLSTGLKNRIKSSALLFTPPLSLPSTQPPAKCPIITTALLCEKVLPLLDCLSILWASIAPLHSAVLHISVEISWFTTEKNRRLANLSEASRGRQHLSQYDIDVLELMSVLAQRLINSFDLVRENATPGKIMPLVFRMKWWRDRRNFKVLWIRQRDLKKIRGRQS